MTTAKTCKASGLKKGRTQLAEISGISAQTLDSWHGSKDKSKRFIFDAVLEKAVREMDKDMFVLQLTRDDNQEAPVGAMTSNCKLWDELSVKTNGNVEHDSTCRLSTEEGYYVWSASESALEKLNNELMNSEGFCSIITDDENHLPCCLEIPEWSEVKAIRSEVLS